jgi:oxygen-independent coproporphyrinogen-3 oxidase
MIKNTHNEESVNEPEGDIMINWDHITDNQYKVSPRDLGLYLHIPFCVRKCDYCDFLSAPAAEETKKEYTDAIITEIESWRGRTNKYVVSTIFFGGGTPSCIDAEDIRRIMEAIGKVFHIDYDRLEATIEVNPGTVDKEKLFIYKEVGLNRLSFGLQSVNNEELKLLGRIHSYEQFKGNYLAAREAGFNNINIDLMSALPGQTCESWENTLRTVIALKPEHISAYSLIIEEGTEFYEHYREGGDKFLELPDEDVDRLMYHRTKEILKEHSYERYEISNYAKSGYKCAHNCTYWNGQEYLGFGLGASSLLNGARITNMHNLKQYIQLCAEFKHNALCRSRKDLGESISDRSNEDRIGLVQNMEVLSIHERIEEFMFLGLRMCVGISQNAFLQRFQTDICSLYGDTLKQLMKQKFLTNEGDMIRLTDTGIDVSNSILALFLFDET